MIFDVVNNFESLYSISAVERELQEAVTFCRNGHCEEEIVWERFEIIDEVRACRQLFEQLEETLTFSWEQMYRQAEAYYEVHGSLDVPVGYKTEDGFRLGGWLANKQQLRGGLNRRRRLSPERIGRLDEIGMIWSHADYAFERNYLAAAEYQLRHGDLNVPADYVDVNGSWLGRWISAQRKAGREGKLTAEQTQCLSAIGMRWLNAQELQWNRMHECAAQYARNNADIEAFWETKVSHSFDCGINVRSANAGKASSVQHRRSAWMRGPLKTELTKG